MNFKRIGRILVCLLLVCALLINISPIKAKAVVLELTAAELLKWGIVAFATLATCGVVYQITSENQLISLGEIFYNEAFNYSTSAEKLDDFDELSSIIGEAVDSGTIPLRGPHISPENGGESLLAAVSILLIDLFCNKNTGNKTVTFQESKLCTTELMTPYYDPGFDGGLGYTCVSYATSSVYRYRVCTANSHMDHYFSDGSFSVRFYRADGTYTYVNAKKYQMDIDGITYVAYTADVGIQSYSGGSGEYNPGCSYGTTSDAQRAGFLAANIGPKQETMDPVYDGSPDFDKTTHSISFPETDISSVNTLDKIREFTGKLSPNLDLYEILEQLTGGAAPEIAPLPEPEPDPGEDTEPTTSTEPIVQPDPNPDPGPGTGSDPDSGGDSAELNWWQRFSQWFLELRTSINELPNRFDEHFENVNNNIQEVPNKFETWIQNVQTSVDSVAESILGTADEINAAISNLPNAFLAHVQNILSAIAAVPQAIVSGIKNVLTELFVPDPEFIPNKVEALKAEYKFLDPMLSTGEDLKFFFQNIGSQPPIIWIDLGAGSAWHPMGGKVKFIDLTWYAQYKPTVDPIVGGFIWLWVAWRMFKAVPGLLAGDSGTVGAPTVAPDITFNPARLPAGRSRKKKDGE